MNEHAAIQPTGATQELILSRAPEQEVRDDRLLPALDPQSRHRLDDAAVGQSAWRVSAPMERSPSGASFSSRDAVLTVSPTTT